jgi:hypothetical protein
MPQRPSKGPQGTNAGSKNSGGQKATYGSGVSPEVSSGQADAIVGDDDVSEHADPEPRSTRQESQ